MLRRWFDPVTSFLGFLLWCCSAGGIGAQTGGSLLDPLSQGLPGSVPEIFAPGVISAAGYRLHGPVVFDPGSGQILWSVVPPSILAVSAEDGAWSDPRPVNLPGRAVQAPAFSAGGRRLFYQAAMEGGEGSLDIWWVERTEVGWGEARNVGPPVNTSKLESQPSLTARGTLYFTGELGGSGLDRGIYRSEWTGDGYGAPELLGGGINSEFIDYCPWIDPEEGYLLFASSRPRQEEFLQIHVSFRSPDGSWSEPRNVHPAMGFEGEGRFPSVSPDGRFLFFVSGDSVYWVDMAPVLALALDGGG